MSEPLPESTKKLKKDQLLDLLQKAQADIGLSSTVRTIARVRRKWLAKGNSDTVHTVVISATEQELLDCAEFIQDLQDVAPPPLRRLAAGVTVMFEQPGE